jgi:hypothetical protein
MHSARGARKVDLEARALAAMASQRAARPPPKPAILQDESLYIYINIYDGDDVVLV